MLGAVSVSATAAGVVERNVHSSAVEIPEPDDGRLIFADNERMPLHEREGNLNVKGHKLGERALAVVDFRSSCAYALYDSGLAYLAIFSSSDHQPKSVAGTSLASDGTMYTGMVTVAPIASSIRLSHFMATSVSATFLLT